MARFTTLYSGSSGNAGVAEHDGQYLLIDIGGSCRATTTALAELKLMPGGLQGILITHEHSDHIRGLQVFLKKNPVRVYGSVATLGMLWQMGAVPETTELVAVDDRLEEIGGFGVRGFATSHDSAGCCGFRITMPEGEEMAIATDLGVVTQEVYAALQGAALVALEANYDTEQLRMGPYPQYLKRRIAGNRGHLSNEDSARTVARLVSEGCRRVALCHLSKENNHPVLVQHALQDALCEQGVRLPEDCRVQISERYAVSPWMEF